MADWGQRAKDKDRDNAIKVIEDAAARGRIVEVDKLKRIQDVNTASTVGEIDLIIRGLGMSEPAAAVPPAPPPASPPAPPANPTFQPYTPPTAPPVAEPDPSYSPPPNVQYGEPLSPSAGTSISMGGASAGSGHGGKLVLILVLVIMAGIAIPIFFGIKAVVDTASDTIDEISNGVGEKPDVISTEGLADLTAALKEETGSSEIFDATLYGQYAVVEVPAEASGKRVIRYYWDGSLQEQGKGTAGHPERFDLADIRADVLQALLKQIRNRVEGSRASNSYVIIHAPTDTDEGAWLYAYASNEYGEGGYISADLDGKVIRRVSW